MSGRREVVTVELTVTEIYRAGSGSYAGGKEPAGTVTTLPIRSNDWCFFFTLTHESLVFLQNNTALDYKKKSILSLCPSANAARARITTAAAVG